MRNNLQTWLLCSLFLAAILFLNWTYSFCSDDCYYALGETIGGEGIPQRLTGIGNAWSANWKDGYRPIVHLFVRIFTGCCDKWVFNVANTAMMGCLLACMLCMAGKWRCGGFYTLTLAITLVFFVLCKGESYLWCAGSVNYLWAGTFSLLFCIVLKRLAHADANWSVVAACCVMAFLAGWLQEAFVLPICAALLAIGMVRRRELNMKWCVVVLFYAVGAVLLVRIAGRRASTIPPFSLSILAMTMLKVAVAVKAVWLLLVVFLVTKDKRAFVRRNLFALLVVFASICMIAIVGFNGERSLWAANLFAIIVIIREFRPSMKLTCIMLISLLPALCICCGLGWRIKNEFNAFTSQYLASEQGLCCHNRVRCGIFARFFYQFVYAWTEGFHGRAYAYFHGRDVVPCALSQDVYDSLRAGTFCEPANRLPIETEAYTTPFSNTIVVPLPDEAAMPNRVRVRYDFPQDFLARLRQELAIRRNPPVADIDKPRTVALNGRRLVFVGKLPESDARIKAITFE